MAASVALLRLGGRGGRSPPFRVHRYGLVRLLLELPVPLFGPFGFASALVGAGLDRLSAPRDRFRLVSERNSNDLFESCEEDGGKLLPHG
ncbi:hypothetical protein NL676_013925 [Syzygium grande]|nr:hypothetical protein NL676_013925 [Syzygium grande]